MGVGQQFVFALLKKKKKMFKIKRKQKRNFIIK